MICPICFGRKYDFKKDGNSGYFVECKKCHGTGIVESQTNEEWLHSCTFEELAGAIYEWYSLGHTRGRNGKALTSIMEIVDWLKEKHDERWNCRI